MVNLRLTGRRAALVLACLAVTATWAAETVDGRQLRPCRNRHDDEALRLARCIRQVPAHPRHDTGRQAGRHPHEPRHPVFRWSVRPDHAGDHREADPGKRFQSMMVISEDHSILPVEHGAGEFTLTRQQIGRHATSWCCSVPLRTQRSCRHEGRTRAAGPHSGPTGGWRQVRGAGFGRGFVGHGS